MQRKPIISVAIATYNRAHLLSRAINSVLNQTYENFELIVIDDCSIDNTKEVVELFGDSRIIYHRHKKNKGYLAARNTGFELTRGKYNCFLGDDDELLPKALETVVKKFNELSEKEIKFLWFDEVNAESGEIAGSGLEQEGYITYEDILRGNISGDFWVVLDIDFLGQSRFDERWRGGDGILWLRLLRKTKAYYVPEVLYKAYREHGGERMSGKRPNLMKYISGINLYQKAFLEENGEELRRLSPLRYGQRLNQFGVYQILNNEILNGRKTLITSFKFNFSLKLFILLSLSFILSRSQIKDFITMFLYRKRFV